MSAHLRLHRELCPPDKEQKSASFNARKKWTAVHGAVDPMKLQSGQQVGAYTVIQELGHGGMSDVFLAQDQQHAREVVLKFPHDDMMGDPSTYERFCREVKIGNALTHPNIQKLYLLEARAGARID